MSPAVPSAAGAAHVTWHDLECGAYRADLTLWLSLARAEGGPVLDLGAGTGRVALALAAAGVQVVALDRDPLLLEVLSERAEGLPLSTVTADARDFSLEERFPLVLAPMQTVQLLGGEMGRGAFLRCAARHLAPGGLLAAAIADELEAFSPHAALPEPDVLERDGWTWISQPTAVRIEGGRVLIERMRERIAPDGQRDLSADHVGLDRLTVAQLTAEAEQVGLRPRPTRRVAPTDEHVGSAVVMLRG
ncbi:MAG: class I SAM-dependent methyltransferase [Solirubrobacteraceae bacterium]